MPITSERVGAGVPDSPLVQITVSLIACYYFRLLPAARGLAALQWPQNKLYILPSEATSGDDINYRGILTRMGVKCPVKNTFPEGEE